MYTSFGGGQAAHVCAGGAVHAPLKRGAEAADIGKATCERNIRDAAAAALEQRKRMRDAVLFQILRKRLPCHAAEETAAAFARQTDRIG